MNGVRLRLLMKRAGIPEGRGAEPYLRLHRWSIENREKFFEYIFEDLDFSWKRKPDMILDWDRSTAIWKAKWFAGGLANVYDACVSSNIRRGYGKSPALIWQREDGLSAAYTYEQVEQNVEAIARALKRSGVGRGDRVVTLLPSSPYAYLLLFAVEKIGAVSVPVPTEIEDEVMLKRLEMAVPKLVVYADGIIYNGKKMDLSHKVNLVISMLKSEKDNFSPYAVVVPYTGSAATDGSTAVWDEWLARASSDPPAETVYLTSEDVTMILFTSGTTGKPKGTLHTFNALIEDMIENAYSSDIYHNDRFFWYTSPGWMMFPWLVTGVNGLSGTVVLYDGSPTYRGKDWLLTFAATYKVTHMGVSPNIISTLLEVIGKKQMRDYGLDSLRELRYTSAPLSDNMANMLGSLGYYPNGACGGTDGCFCYCSGNPVTPRKGATMLPGLGIDVHIMVYDNCIWRDAASGELGEIVIKEPFISMTNGLLLDDERRSYFRKTYFNMDNYEKGNESQFWFHGDLASRDDEGYITIHGRADDLLVVHGNKISPYDVINVAVRTGRVKDVIPVALSVKDGDGGELFLFAVKSESGEGIPETELSAMLKSEIKNHVNRLATPYEIFYLHELPYTITNKPAFRLVKRAFMHQPLGDLSTIRNPASTEPIIEAGERFRRNLINKSH